MSDLPAGFHGVGELAASYLARQSWCSPDSGELQVERFEILREGMPGLAQLLLRRGDDRFQLILGWRQPAEAADVLRGREAALLGTLEQDDASVLVYDALADDELAMTLLAMVTGGAESASRVRRVSSLASHSSLVFDERLFMKCYRILEAGPRPEVEMVLRLDQLGFNALLAPVAHWTVDGVDLALVREFLPGALEGRLLALTSLRDLLAHASEGDAAAQQAEALEAAVDGQAFEADRESALAGGDLASEMRRVGTTTARLHLALAEAFGDEPAKLSTFADAEESDAGARARLAALGSSRDHLLGRTIRLHGDYHLRRVMRFEAGWLVAGFSDDPIIAQSGRRPGRRGSPIEDLADFSTSLAQVADEALAQRPRSEGETAARLASAWVRRNKAAFLEGYVATEGIDTLLPSDRELMALLLEGFERSRAQRYEATSAEA